LTFLNPEKDVLGAGWQITQSKIALGSGGLFGKGFLQGSQSQLDYLPEKQTDFVFTLIGEEFGFIGNIAIIFVYFLIIISITGIGLKAKNRFSRLVASGLAMVIFLYVFVNIAMVTGVLPVVGAPLPLLSYGGTALLTVFVILGISVNLSQNSQKEDLEIS
jgi:rod shape determining protein RodA